MQHPARTIVLIEGRDGAGKTTLARNLGDTIPEARVVALARPSESELRRRYFARWLATIRRERARVLVFDRSWYSRACVEWPMGFCTERELARFHVEVPRIEAALVRAGIRLLKIYVEISDAEQRRRVLRRASPSALDRAAIARAGDFRQAAEEMLRRTSTPLAPWHVLEGSGKKGKGIVEWIGRYCSRDFVCSTSEVGNSASRS
jgi:polyphosphate kinase 2 (PPK2 family)